MAVKNVNFLLKYEAPAQQFDVTGTVYADLNGNGIFDGNDALASNVFVYQDVNRNGFADASEQRVLTDTNGQYTLTIPATHADTYAVGVIPPTNLWLPTDPGHDGVEDVFAGPGSPTQIVNFFLDPPSDAFPDGGNGPGTVQGVVFNDLDGDGTRDPGENGVEGFRVFIDANENGTWENATEVSVLTSNLGSYFFSNVSPGLIRLDIVIPNEGLPAAAWNLTTPVLGYREVTLGDGGSVEGITFGIDNLADFDWGDLPNSYSTTAATNGPRHFVTPGFQLGASVDGEVDGMPTPVATGEGLVGDNDNGVLVVSNGGILKKGENTLRVTVAGVGGLLTGWMDFNADGHFDESERLSWSLSGSSLGGEADINPGTYDLQITIPASAVDGALATRIRWGEQGLTFTGAAAIGEVEDYFFGLNFLFGDYNRNGTVDQADYNVWRNTKGQAVAPFTGRRWKRRRRHRPGRLRYLAIALRRYAAPAGGRRVDRRWRRFRFQQLAERRCRGTGCGSSFVHRRRLQQFHRRSGVCYVWADRQCAFVHRGRFDQRDHANPFRGGDRIRSGLRYVRVRRKFVDIVPSDDQRRSVGGGLVVIECRSVVAGLGAGRHRRFHVPHHGRITLRKRTVTRRRTSATSRWPPC